MEEITAVIWPASGTSSICSTTDGLVYSYIFKPMLSKCIHSVDNCGSCQVLTGILRRFLQLILLCGLQIWVYPIPHQYHSVVSNSAIPWTTACQAPWNSSGKNTAVSCHFFLQVQEWGCTTGTKLDTNHKSLQQAVLLIQGRCYEPSVKWQFTSKQF